MNGYNEYYERLKDLTAEEVKKEIAKLLKKYWPDFHPEKSEEEKELMQEESRKIIEALQMIKGKKQSDGLFSEFQDLNLFDKKMDEVFKKPIENFEYVIAYRETGITFYDLIKRQDMVNDTIIELYGEKNQEIYKKLINIYRVWVDNCKKNGKRVEYHFEDWLLNIGKKEILEQRYIKRICGEYNEQNRKQLYNKYIKSKILNFLGFNKNKKELNFLDWLIEQYGKEYHSYDNFVVTK